MGTATHPSNRKVRLAVLAGGLAFLAMGIAYYHAFREVGSLYFGAILGLHNGATREEFAPWLPSFLHTLAFSLMTAAVVWGNFGHVLIELERGLKCGFCEFSGRAIISLQSGRD